MTVDPLFPVIYSLFLLIKVYLLMQRVYFYEVFQGLFGTLLIRNFFTRYFLGLFQEETWSFTFDTQIGLFTLPNEQGVRALSHSRLFVENVDYG